MVPTTWQDAALARHGVSREVPVSVLKQNSYVEALTPNMIVFGSRAFELIRFR